VKKTSPVISLVLCLAVSFVYFSCKKGQGPTDLASMTKVVAGDVEKGYMDKVHDSHEGAVKCVECHHKDENPDRIKKCADCHADDDAKEKAESLCLGCHKGGEKK
jgi:cytochrome c553